MYVFDGPNRSLSRKTRPELNFTTAAGGDVFRCWRARAVSTGGSDCGRGGGGDDDDKRGRGGFWQEATEGRREGRTVSTRTEIHRPQSDDLKVKQVSRERLKLRVVSHVGL